MKRERIIIGMLALLMIAGCATQKEKAEQQAKMRLAIAEAPDFVTHFCLQS